MSLYVFSKKAENDLIEIYRYGFINYGENRADLSPSPGFCIFAMALVLTGPVGHNL